MLNEFNQHFDFNMLMLSEIKQHSISISCVLLLFSCRLTSTFWCSMRLIIIWFPHFDAQWYYVPRPAAGGMLPSTRLRKVCFQYFSSFGKVIFLLLSTWKHATTCVFTVFLQVKREIASTYCCTEYFPQAHFCDRGASDWHLTWLSLSWWDASKY